MGLLLNAITGGVGSNTPLSNQSQLENNILIGDVDTAMPLQGLKVSVGGKTTIDIQGSVPLVSVFAKFMNRIAGTVIGLAIKIGTGRLNVSGSSITFTNGGATTPSVYGWSDNSSNAVAIEAQTVGINALSNQTFDDFAGLFITPLANVGSFDVTFADGTPQNMTVVEADAIFSQMNDTEANGRLDALVTGFDNRKRTIRSVKVNATTALTVLVVK
jgi:hypothetical protein